MKEDTTIKPVAQENSDDINNKILTLLDRISLLLGGGKDAEKNETSNNEEEFIPCSYETKSLFKK